MAQLAHEEIQKALSTEVAQHFVEVIGEVLFERSYEVCASFVGQPDPHGGFVFVLVMSARRKSNRHTGTTQH